MAHRRAASLGSWIELNCLLSAAVGKASRLSIIGKILLTAWVIPEQQVEFAQLYKYHHQSGKAVSGKLVWKQHTLHTKQYNRVYRFQAEELKELISLKFTLPL